MRIRRALWDAAVRLATAVGYVSAGTCEFLVGADGSWVFLELNARLQVEHPVTELVLGRDLVADQLGIAGGATLAELGLEQAAIEAALATGGHAIEARLNAEDPANGFLPSAGRVVAIRWPDDAVAFGPVGEAGIRVDAGIEAGDVVGGRFDPLLAKVIAHGPDRATALARLADALDGTELLGLPTNLAFLRRLVRTPVVVDGDARTTTLAHRPRRGGRGRRAGRPGHGLGGRRPPARRRGRRPGVERRVAAERRDPGPSRRRRRRSGDHAHDRAAGASHAGRGDRRRSPPGTATRRSSPWRVGASPSGSRRRRISRPVPRALASGGGDAHDAELVAPMPGLVVGVHVRAGDEVKAGDRVATLEAMKMEHVVTAPRDGRVEEVAVRQGEQVERGRLVARLGAVS